MTDRQVGLSHRPYFIPYYRNVDIPSLPPGLRAFIAHHVPSMVHLEVLLLLSRDERRAWSARDAAVAVRCGLERASAALQSLAARGLVRRAGGGEFPLFQYDPVSADLRTHVTQLDTLERQRPVTLIRAIHETPLGGDALAEVVLPADRERGDDDGG
jgi:hypothetical protein